MIAHLRDGCGVLTLFDLAVRTPMVRKMVMFIAETLLAVTAKSFCSSHRCKRAALNKSAISRISAF
jgi:hypothetical protein